MSEGKQPKGKTEKVEDKATEKKRSKDEREKEKQEEISTYKKEQDEKMKKERKKMVRKPYKLPFWLRMVSIVLGLVFIGLSLLALSYEDTALDNAILILAIILGLSGISRLINAFYEKEIGGTTRIIRFLFSVVLIVLALIVFFLPDAGEDVLYVILALGLIFGGTGRIFLGIKHKAFPFWLKVVQLLMGAVSLLLGLTAILPELVEIDYPVSVLTLLVIGFFISGLSRLTLGLVGVGAQKREN